jgi:hypothetical protein
MMGVSYQTLLMRSLPPQIFEHLTTINPAVKSNEALQEVIINAGKKVEGLQATETNFRKNEENNNKFSQ